MLTTFLLYFTSFFTLMNPLGAVPAFLGLTDRMGRKEQKATANRGMITAFLILVLFAFLGKYVFEFFNISIAGLKVVGSVIFFIMGYDMLNSKVGRMKTTSGNSEDDPDDMVGDVAITPLGIPLIAGPGSITNAMVLMGESPSWIDKGLVILSILVVSILGLIILRSSSAILKILGRQGTKIMTKLMGLILMIIAVEFFFSGITPFVKAMLH
jgi:multiple antibiotic resistance protein